RHGRGSRCLPARDLLPPPATGRTPANRVLGPFLLEREEAAMSVHQKNLLLEPMSPTEPAPARRPWISAPALLALIVGAVLGLLFGGILGDLVSLDALGIHFPLGEIGGALFGMVAGVVFVLLALLLYRFIQDAASGALVLGLFGLIAMGLVGGLFGAVIGFVGEGGVVGRVGGGGGGGGGGGRGLGGAGHRRQ